MCDGRLLATGWMKWVIEDEGPSARVSYPEMIPVILVPVKYIETLQCFLTF